MKMQTSCPGPDDKYYINRSFGGWNPCIEGNPNNRPFNGSVLANCIGAATGRFNALGGSGWKYLGNAYPGYMLTLAKQEGLEIWQKAAVGGMIVLLKADGMNGHVISVEKIKGGFITTWESGWNYTPGCYCQNRQITKGNNYGMSSAYEFAGCIVNPEVDPYPFSMEYVNKWHARGEGVKAVQWALNKAGCYAPGADNSIDGSCGPATIDAITAYQMDHVDIYGNPLEADGSAGPLTQGSMQQLYSIV